VDDTELTAELNFPYIIKRGTTLGKGEGERGEKEEIQSPREEE